MTAVSGSRREALLTLHLLSLSLIAEGITSWRPPPKMTSRLKHRLQDVEVSSNYNESFCQVRVSTSSCSLLTEAL